MTSSLPLLPTTVIGSYSMPEWLERAKNDYLSRRVSRRDLDEMHDAVRKAAIKDQEAAGVDVVSDGEAQRDNMIDYFTERMPGVQLDQSSKRFYYDFYDSMVRSKLATGSLGLAEEARFLGEAERPGGQLRAHHAVVEVVVEALGALIELHTGQPLGEVVDHVVALQLAIGDDVDARDLLILDRRLAGGVVHLVEIVAAQAPVQVVVLRALEPFRHRVAANDRGRKKRQ